jgi:hypothetical protein
MKVLTCEPLQMKNELCYILPRYNGMGKTFSLQMGRSVAWKGGIALKQDQSQKGERTDCNIMCGIITTLRNLMQVSKGRTWETWPITMALPIAAHMAFLLGWLSLLSMAFPGRHSIFLACPTSLRLQLHSFMHQSLWKWLKGLWLCHTFYALPDFSLKCGWKLLWS